MDNKPGAFSSRPNRLEPQFGQKPRQMRLPLPPTDSYYLTSPTTFSACSAKNAMAAKADPVDRWQPLLACTLFQISG